MKLVRDRILLVCNVQREVADEVELSGLGENHPTIVGVAELKGMPPQQMYKSLVQDTIDFLQLQSQANVAQTVIFSAEQALALRPALDRFQEQPELRFPFPFMILQFDRPIKENEFFAQEEGHWTNADKDSILAVVCSQDEDRFMCTAFFASNEIQAVKWEGPSLDFERYIREKSPSWDTARQNKRQLQLLVMACMHYLNCENVVLEQVAADPKTNRKRESKGKRPLPDYYVVKVTKTKYENTPAVESTGRHVSFMFSVRGHFRRLQSGKVIWVRDHHRGVKYEEESIREKVYKVDYDKNL